MVAAKTGPFSRLRSSAGPAIDPNESDGSMARTCTICHHHRRGSVDKALLRGEQLKADRPALFSLGRCPRPSSEAHAACHREDGGAGRAEGPGLWLGIAG